MENAGVSYLGIPLAPDKLEGPSTSLSFLGIILDTERMEIMLPKDKLTRMQQLLMTWLLKKKARKRQILSLVGTLQHATKLCILAEHLSQECIQRQLSSTRCTSSLG